MELQTLIGVDKKNPHFTLCRRADDPGKLYVFFGSTLLEIVPDDQTSPAWKLLVARLYNAGVKRESLKTLFGVALTTMKRWGDALTSGNAKTLLQALSGRGAPRKLTKEIRGFIELRFAEIYQQTHYDYSRRIRKEIKTIFRIDLCSETLRLVFGKLKDRNNESEKNLEGPSDHREENRANTCDEEPALQRGREEEVIDLEEDRSNFEKLENSDNRNNSLNFDSKESPSMSTPYFFCNHIGVLLFSEMIVKLKEFVGAEKSPMIKQWIISLLLGALNIEQTKLLDFDSLHALFGDAICRGLDFQRNYLSVLATDDTYKKALLRYNASLVHVCDCHDFYYDPHTKHYTGIRKILKGWIANMKKADKTMNMDFIHTSEGAPVYITHTDTFHDLRERFMETILDFRELIKCDERKKLSFVFDRGIYKMEVFEQIRNSANNHFITWEKGFKKEEWDENKTDGTFSMSKARNNSTDLLLYTFKYRRAPWKKNDRITRILVQATNPKGRTIVVSILSSHTNRNAEELIRLMFNRWLQENDFKYLDKHFGINQITSYATISYKKLENSVEDKQMLSGQYKALQLQKTNLKNTLGKLLVRDHTGTKKNKKREEKIKELTNQLCEVDQKLSHTDKKVSRLETLIEEQYSRLVTGQKSIMDSIRLITRNMFYETLGPFRELYDNYRDDHTIFRNLTHSNGCVVFDQEKVKVILFPTVNYSPKTRQIMEKVLEQINQRKPTMPYGPQRKIHFKLGKKTSKLFAIGNW